METTLNTPLASAGAAIRAVEAGVSPGAAPAGASPGDIAEFMAALSDMTSGLPGSKPAGRIMVSPLRPATGLIDDPEAPKRNDSEDATHKADAVLALVPFAALSSPPPAPQSDQGAEFEPNGLSLKRGPDKRTAQIDDRVEGGLKAAAPPHVSAEEAAGEASRNSARDESGPGLSADTPPEDRSGEGIRRAMPDLASASPHDPGANRKASKGVTPAFDVDAIKSLERPSADGVSSEAQRPPIDATSALRAAAAPARSSDFDLPQATARQISFNAFTRLGEDVIEVRLDPPDLGKISIEFTDLGPHGIKAVISADLPGTLDLLRRHSEGLVQELARYGFSGADLQFSDRSGKEGATPERRQGAVKAIRAFASPEQTPQEKPLPAFASTAYDRTV